MGKFMKGCLITALVLVLLGLVVTIGAAAAGGLDLVRSVLRDGTGTVRLFGQGWFYDWEEWNGDWDEWDEDWDQWEEDGKNWNDTIEFAGSWEEHKLDKLGEIGEIAEEAGEYGDLAASGITQIGDGGRAVFESGRITDLDVDLAGGGFYIRSSDEDTVKVTMTTGPRTEVDRIQCYLDGETLVLRDYRAPRIKQYDERKIFIDLPEGMTFREADINFGAGSVKIHELNAEDVRLIEGAGSIELGEVNAGTVECTINAGEGIIKSGNIQSGSMKVNLGHIEYRGSISESLYGECNMGALEIRLEGGQEDYDYFISSNAGRVQVGTESGVGAGVTKSITNGTGKNITLSCNMGEIKVSFTE